jgi:hypothetical protein
VHEDNEWNGKSEGSELEEESERSKEVKIISK